MEHPSLSLSLCGSLLLSQKLENLSSKTLGSGPNSWTQPLVGIDAPHATQAELGLVLLVQPLVDRVGHFPAELSHYHPFASFVGNSNPNTPCMEY